MINIFKKKSKFNISFYILFLFFIIFFIKFSTISAKANSFKIVELEISKTYNNNFNKEFVIIRLGLDDGSLEKKSFVINVNPSSTLLAFNFTDNLSLCKKVFKFWGEIGFTDDDLKIRKNHLQI